MTPLHGALIRASRQFATLGALAAVTSCTASFQNAVDAQYYLFVSANGTSPYSINAFSLDAVSRLTEGTQNSVDNSSPLVVSHPSRPWIATSTYAGSPRLVTTYSVNAADGALTQMSQLTIGNQSLRALALDPIGEFIVVGMDTYLHLVRWDARTGAVTSLPGYDYVTLDIQVPAMAFHPNGIWLYVIRQSTISVSYLDVFSIAREAGTLTLMQSLALGANQDYRRLVMHPDGHTLIGSEVVSGGSGVVSFSIDPSTGLATYVTKNLGIIGGQGGFKFTSDGRYLVNWASAGSLQLYRLDSETHLLSLYFTQSTNVGSNTNIFDLAISPDGTKIYGAEYGAGKLYELGLDEASGYVTLLQTFTTPLQPQRIAIVRTLKPAP
ncbi:MAG: hypothetical protein AB7P04_08040 [Bacteriovoracia bacterium]